MHLINSTHPPLQQLKRLPLGYHLSYLDIDADELQWDGDRIVKAVESIEGSPD
jgi:hypothetical protein